LKDNHFFTPGQKAARCLWFILNWAAHGYPLMDLRECCAACPLYLIGYTCSLGVESENQKLSRHRAETVDALLRKNGYKVASAEGKGMIYGSNPESKRMVEIKLTKK
jgi:hypothetical protein